MAFRTTLSGLFTYPLKSCAGIALTSAQPGRGRLRLGDKLRVLD